MPLSERPLPHELRKPNERLDACPLDVPPPHKARALPLVSLELQPLLPRGAVAHVLLSSVVEPEPIPMPLLRARDRDSVSRAPHLPQGKRPHRCDPNLPSVLWIVLRTNAHPRRFSQGVESRWVKTRGGWLGCCAVTLKASTASVKGPAPVLNSVSTSGFSSHNRLRYGRGWDSRVSFKGHVKRYMER
jgi:hypothetical protein